MNTFHLDYVVEVAGYCYSVAGSGRPKSSSMWNHFTYDKDTDKQLLKAMHYDKVLYYN